MIAIAEWDESTSVVWEDRDPEASFREGVRSRRKRQPTVQSVNMQVARYRIVQHKVNGSGWLRPGQAGTPNFLIVYRDWLAKSAGSASHSSGRKSPAIMAALERHSWDVASSSLSTDVGRPRVRSGGGHAGSNFLSLMTTEEAWSEFARSCVIEGTRLTTSGHDAARPLSASPDTSTGVPAEQDVIQLAGGCRDVAWCAEVSQALLSARHLTDDAARKVALAAMEDVHTLARTMTLPPPKSTNVSEEGLVSLVWETTTHALLIVFTGDGEGSFSVKMRGDLFVTITDFAVADGLPLAARSVLDLSTAL